ncbi:hypothetical protein PENTCL1PPCAC_2245, partial [Pristionchus entomophagus]
LMLSRLRIVDISVIAAIMLRRFKQQVTEAVNAVNERASGDSSSMGSNEEKEGFVCPQCMNIFPTPDELSDHFLTHTQESSSSIPMRIENPNFDATSVNGRRKSELESMPPERLVEELQSQLKDEKWYSAELKKELERINSVIAQSNQVPEEEVPYLMQQIQVLEAGKSMVTQRLMELEKEGMGLRRTLDSEKGEKGDIMKKLKDLTSKIRDITDENEKHKVEKEQLSSELAILRSSAQKLEKELVNLNQILQERPSEDDVLVLKNELINAQKLMDEITKEKEVELSEQHNSIRMLSQEREKQHILIQNLEKQIAVSGSTSLEHVSRASTLESTMAALEKENDEIKKKVEELEAKMAEQSKTVHSLRVNLSSALEEKGRLDEAIETNTRQAEILNESNQCRLEELNEKMKLLMGEKKRLEADLNAIEERDTIQNDSIKDLEQSNLDLTNEVSSLNLLLEKEKEKLKAKKEEVDIHEKEAKEGKDKLTEERIEKDKMKCELESLRVSMEGLKRENGIVKENAQLLRNQISEGESGMKTVMDQLNEEKERLANDVIMMGDALKGERESASSLMAEMEKKMRDIENDKEKEIKKFKEDLEGLNERLGQAEEEIMRKSDRFSEMEKEMEEERRKGGERIGKMKEVIDGLVNEKDEEKTKREETCRLVDRLEKEVKEKERQVGESRGKIGDALRRVKDAEEKARRLEEELSLSSASLESTSQSEKEVSKKMEEERNRVNQLSMQLQSTKKGIESLNEELTKLRQDSEESEKHWKIKLAEKESVIAGNEKMNEELIEKEKERERELEEKRKEIEEKEKQIDSLKDQLEEEGMKIGEMEKENEERKRNIEAVQESLVMISGEKEGLEKLMREWKENGEESKEIIESLTNELKKEKKIMEETIEMVNAREKNMEEEMMRRAEDIDAMRGEMERSQSSLIHERDTRIRLEEEVKEKTEEIDSFQARICGFEDESASLRREVERLEKEVGAKEEKCEEIERKAQQTVSEWKEKKIDEEGKVEVMKRENEENEKKIDQLSICVISMESNILEMEEERTRLRIELDKIRAELEVEIHKGSEREEDHLRIEVELRSDMEKNRRSMESALSDRLEMEKRRKEATEAMELLTVKNMELVQAAAAFDEEKSALIERCLNTESDLDFERERALENKHRFDEAISAMHELGRANQSLQMDMNKMTGRKWLDDSEALNCTHCAKLFSLTVRKHHCRVCGFIFCSSCSNKTIKIASHKNPVRVCDHCHSDVSTR